MFRLGAAHISTLVKETETGMGYQLVDAQVNGNQARVFVFNCELLIFPAELAEVTGRRHEKLLARAVAVSSFTPLTVLPPSPSSPVGAPPSPFTPSTTPAAAGAALAPTPLLTRKTAAHDGFVRFSAYAKDNRVLPDGSLANNTYATTIGDARFAISGLAVAGRYALPNPSPAIYAYALVPGAGVSVLVGTAKPANVQAGGGVEVLFQKGTGPGTAFTPYEIPEW